MSGEAHRRRLRALLRLAGVRTRERSRPAFETAFVHESHAQRARRRLERAHGVSRRLGPRLHHRRLALRALRRRARGLADAAQGRDRQRRAARADARAGSDFASADAARRGHARGRRRRQHVRAGRRLRGVRRARSTCATASKRRGGSSSSQHVEQARHSVGRAARRRRRACSTTRRSIWRRRRSIARRAAARRSAGVQVARERQRQDLGKGSRLSKKAAQQAAAEAALAFHRRGLARCG